MQSNQQQQSKNAADVKNQVAKIDDDDAQAVFLCPNCQEEIAEDSLFCPECGGAVKQHICPNCRKPNSPSSDICEFCGSWLLEGKCKFCYAELDDGAAFCPECAKPKDGIPCPNCGTLSLFDFCTKCGKPVTPEAIAEAQAVQASMPVTANPQTAEMEEELAELEALINSEPEIDEFTDEPAAAASEPQGRKSLLSANIINSFRKTGAEMEAANQRRIEAERIAEEKRKVAEAKRLAEEEERQRKIREAQAQKEALQKKLAQDKKAADATQKAQAIAAAKQNSTKRFHDNQAARRFHTARRHPDAIGWQCNYAGCVHLWAQGGPNHCNDPGKGGCDYFGSINDLERNQYGYWFQKE